MDPSSLIFVVIIGIWAVYLLGHWVRRRDQLATARSVDRFSDAMRVLQPRAAAPLARPSAPTYVVAPVRVPIPVVAPATPARTSSRAAAIRRRARILAALVVATALAWPSVALTVVPWWVAAVITGLLLALVAQLRATARRRQRTLRREAMVRRRAVVSRRRQRGQPRATADRADGAAAAVAAVPDGVGQPGVGQPAEDQPAATGSGWSPVPVPPPTYTLKPKAPTVVRPVPVPAPAPAPVVEPTLAAPAFDLDEILERRIAAGA